VRYFAPLGLNPFSLFFHLTNLIKYGRIVFYNLEEFSLLFVRAWAVFFGENRLKNEILGAGGQKNV